MEKTAEHRSGQSEPHCEVYRTNHEYICKHIKIDKLKTQLYQEDKIHTKLFQQIDRKAYLEGTYAGNELFLLEVLVTNPDEDSFWELISLLGDTGQKRLADVLCDALRKQKDSMQGGKKKAVPGQVGKHHYPTQESQGHQLPGHIHSNPKKKPPLRNVQECAYVDSLAQAAHTPDASASKSPKGNVVKDQLHPGLLEDFEIDEASLSYDKHDSLGQGGSGEVFKGTYGQTPCAVKSIAAFTKKAEARDFIKENQEMICNMSIKHEAIVEFHGYRVEPQKTFYKLLMVFEFIDGLSLNTVLHTDVDQIKEDYSFDESQKHYIAIQICGAIEYMHQKKIIHRDIKPANILITKAATAKLCDMGLSEMKESLSQDVSRSRIHHADAGTILYMAFELLERSGDKKIGASEATDMYAYGATLYELYTGKNIWHLGEILNGETKIISAMKGKDIPEALVDHNGKEPMASIARCVQRNPKSRPTAKQLKAALELLPK